MATKKQLEEQIEVHEAELLEARYLIDEYENTPAPEPKLGPVSVEEAQVLLIEARKAEQAG